MNDVVVEIADRNCVQRPSLEMFGEAPENRLILPVRVGLFQSLDVFQVLRHRRRKRHGFRRRRGSVVSGNSQFFPFQFVALPALGFLGLSDCYASLRSAALARLVPFNEVTAIRQSGPIITAGRLAWNGAENPPLVGFDSFEKVYPGHTSILNLFSWMDNI
jgi:hypothetical protein